MEIEQTETIRSTEEKEAKVFDLINIIDLEATCWNGHPPNGQFADIIEIGIAQVDIPKLEIVSATTFLVKPTRSEIGWFCTKLTTITTEMIEQDGITLEQACGKLKELYKSKKTIFASWGDYDRKMFDKCCNDLNIKYPFGPRHINLKTMFSLIYGLDKELGMDNALKHLKINLQGTHHRGGDDAYNTAIIFCEMMKTIRRGIAA